MGESGRRSQWKKIVGVIAFFVAFPILMTFFMGWKGENENKRDDGYVLMGKNVVIQRKECEIKMDVEKFIPCVLVAQMDIESPKEALKAQAVVIRTYIVHQLGNKSEISAEELGLPYITYEEMMGQWKNKSKIENSKRPFGVIENFLGIHQNEYFVERCRILNRIVKKTNLQVMKSEGNVILPLFHAISCGVTRDGKEVFGEKYSYLSSVKCDSDRKEDGYLQIKYFKGKELAEDLEKEKIIVYKDGKEYFQEHAAILEDADEFLKEIRLDYDKTEYVKTVKICDTGIAGEDFAKALGIQSTNMKIEKYENGLRITAKGQGHGFGMSLAQAKNYANQGYDYQKILKTFYNIAITEE